MSAYSSIWLEDEAIITSCHRSRIQVGKGLRRPRAKLPAKPGSCSHATQLISGESNFFVGDPCGLVRGTTWKNAESRRKATLPAQGQPLLPRLSTTRSAPDVLPTIFEPFVTTKGETGTGLGLWVTSEIVKKNGWKIHVRSSKNPARRGTVFSLLIPKLDSA